MILITFGQPWDIIVPQKPKDFTLMKIRSLLVLSASVLVLTSCGSDSAETQTSLVTLPTPPAPDIASPAAAPVPSPAPAPAPTPSPAPTAAPTPSPTSFGMGGMPAIASNFYRSEFLGPSGIPESAKPDVVGAFRFICQPSHIAYDDPIVYPGQKGASHLHQFFGNTEADADSTYQSLRTSGDSTCMNKLNRSAYWIPVMLDGKGNVVRPDYIQVYYKRLPENSPECQQRGNECVAQPNGIRYITGYDMAGGPTTGGPHVWCREKTYRDLPETIEKCGSDITEILMKVSSPDCWDGKNLDSPDHRSHMASASYGNTGIYQCPKTHPKVVPQFTLAAHYTIDPATDDLKLWRLASDKMAGTKPGGSFHGDLFDAWDPETKVTWTANCINKLLSCIDGQLGNDTIMKRWSGFGYKATPRLVSIPANKTSHMANMTH